MQEEMDSLCQENSEKVSGRGGEGRGGGWIGLDWIEMDWIEIKAALNCM